ncbi:MAG TPA: serine/threonine protein kinase, partial [Mycobacterium sp.]|nr:serine/threonine protein kinase [Mycobacterium sp.]
MSGAETPDADVGTQPARPDELGMDSTSTVRPMATQAIFRPNFDDEDDEPSGGTATTEPDELHHPTVARKLSPTR